MKTKEAYFLLKNALEQLEWVRANTKLPHYKDIELAQATKSVRDVFVVIGKKFDQEPERELVK